MHPKRRWLAGLLVIALTVMGLGLTASADSGLESQFLSKLNAERTSRGLAPLEVSGSLRSHARSHSAFQANGSCADGKSICHSSSSQLRAAAGSGWSKLGENVGRGPSVSSIHKMLMDSQGHRKNILGCDYNYVGIGVAVKDGYIYVTQVFMAKGSTCSSSTPTPAPKKSSTPKATTTTTTIPPTTTTTLVVPPDKATTPGNDCLQANRFWQLCHD